MADEFRGTAEPLTKAGFDTAVLALGAEAASLWSVVTVETGGFGFLPDRRPKILFERHIFHERSGGKFSAQHPDISNRDAGGYIGGTAEYERLSRAIGLDRVAALESVSWGLPQIMITRFQASETAQLDGMVRFISHNKTLAKALKDKAWESFAKIYNGPGFAKNEYDKKLAKFHHQFATGPQPDIDIRADQLRLSYLGHNPNGIDGVLGKGTRRAVSAFQTERGLPVTGELDAPTRAKLKEAAGV
jgi:N-acetylmuramidase/Putative peptidoglycan binding domain